MNTKICAGILTMSLLAFSAGCTNLNKTQSGALSGGAVGALGGAGISAIAGGNAGVGALIGGGIGAIGGAIVGHEQSN